MSTLNKVIAVLLLLSVVKNIYNYQERDIFLGVPDNVCHYGQKSDMINIIAKLDGVQRLKFVTDGGTGCYPWSIR